MVKLTCKNLIGTHEHPQCECCRKVDAHAWVHCEEMWEQTLDEAGKIVVPAYGYGICRHCQQGRLVYIDLKSIPIQLALLVFDAADA